MLCCSEYCEKKNQCGLYWYNPQPDVRKYDNVENLESFGSGGIDANGNCWNEYVCGPLGNYAMFTPIPEQMIFEKIANEINSCGFGIEITAEAVKACIEQFKR